MSQEAKIPVKKRASKQRLEALPGVVYQDVNTLTDAGSPEDHFDAACLRQALDATLHTNRQRLTDSPGLPTGYYDADLLLGHFDADLASFHLDNGLSTGYPESLGATSNRLHHQSDSAGPLTDTRSKPDAINHQRAQADVTGSGDTCQINNVQPIFDINGLHQEIFTKVAATGLPNFLQARMPVPSGLNIKARRRHLAACNYPDALLCDFLEFGFPMNYVRDRPPEPATKHHHASALAFSEHVANYTETELSLGALAGPFKTPPFTPWFQANALMTREEKQPGKRRIIMDLSWPHGLSVNSGIPSDTYLGQPYKLRLPTVDHLAELIVAHGRGCPWTGHYWEFAGMEVSTLTRRSRSGLGTALWRHSE